ncbi:unnamed protein product [Gongylonema pulchrum]|uniref:Uncharacterized protein n=1 Tax=Gongylonema pulchrum TaxID=637853 RepID=A0A183E1D0_9BILA|nr:unnamed protein product [Gongylonema pulchrum]
MSAATASEDNWELVSKQQIIDEQNNSEDDEDYDDDDDDDDWVHMYGHPYERESNSRSFQSLGSAY